ncbi:hypothetical protein FRC02_006748 [Tulasnella sp. 418]|nr:hypothetical protein FRC02_006748 [Tulasnella sp. 418]
MGPSRYQRSASGRQSSDETGATIATIAPTIHNLLLHPSVLSALLKHLSFREFLPLLSCNKALKKSIQDQKEIKELVLERYLGVTVGYERWSVGRMGRRQEPIRLSLRDLNSYMRGESISLQNMRSIGQEYVSALASKAQPSSRHAKAAVPSNLKDAVRLIASSCRAYTRIVARLRAQAEAIAAYGMSPFSLSSDTTDPGTERISGRCEKAPTSLYTAGCAALLKVFVPSPEGWWLSDATVVDCRKQLERADVLGLLQVGDIVWDVAAGERRNDGRMIWDGKYWLDLDYAHSRMGEIPPSVDSLAFPLSFWDHSLIRSDDPVYYFDLSPFVVEIASNIERVESSSLTETPEGDPYFVSDWSYRTRFRIRPGMRVGSMTASSDLAGQRQQPAVVNSDWVGSVLIETESTNEGLADLQARCGNSVILAPAGHILREKDGSGWRLSNDGVVKRSPFKLLRKKSRPGNIWLQCILGKETPP